MTEPEKFAFVLKHYPDHELNPGDTDPMYRFDVHGILGFCGCGRPEEAARWLADYLRALRITPMRATAEQNAERWEAIKQALGGPEMYDGPMAYVIQYWADDRGWADHGSNVTTQWLTEKGEAALIVAEWVAGAEDEDD